MIGAGAGLSAAAGLVYGGKRFTGNFGDFIRKYGTVYMQDMYSAGFYPFPTEEERWAYWARHAYINRIEPDGLPVYRQLFELAGTRDYFVLTTNVDHQFWKAGFCDDHIFATQGDYGLIQCAKGCHQKTYDAVRLFEQMNEAERDCKIPSDMVPKCPVCGGPMEMNLRKDGYFVQDDHWNKAAERYGIFLEKYAEKNVVLLEAGVGFNTPAIIRFPFERMLYDNKKWSLIRLNRDEAAVPAHLGPRALGVQEDIAVSIQDIVSEIKNKEAL
ncbi:Sir2 silent information regulator family NAD-dependent deacetylase [Clostridium sp. AM58-1XD]|nr:Sir2 silent information regulator family NAD-dependent deacetylase [Clostridium sp. AM58-1XD]